MHTPYHALGADRAATVPAWVGRRQVVRAGFRTLYLIDTSNLRQAQLDIRRLRKLGWQVEVDRHGDGARLTVTQRQHAA